jgi:hypothetical protein
MFTEVLQPSPELSAGDIYRLNNKVRKQSIASCCRFLKLSQSMRPAGAIVMLQPSPLLFEC